MAKVLIGCEYSGRTRNAFAALGHEAFSADFEDSEDGSVYHYRGDLFDLLKVTKFDLAIFHPPCTYLAVSGLHWNKKQPWRAAETEKALEFVQRLMELPIPRIAIENPISCISSRIRKPDQIIQPWQFGEDASKSTCLWLKGLPLLKPTAFVEPRLICCGQQVPNDDKYGCPHCLGEKKPKPRWGNQCDSGQNNLGPSETRWKDRSRTYQGIADAFAAQWSPLLPG